MPQDRAGRTENWLRTAHVAKQFNEAGLISLCAFVAPSAEGREQARALIGAERLITVYAGVAAGLPRTRSPGAVCGGRGQYPRRVLPYDVPLDADLVIDTQALSVEDGVKQVLDLLRERQAI